MNNKDTKAYQYLISQLDNNNVVYEESYNSPGTTVSFNISKVPYELSELFSTGKYGKYVESYNVHSKIVKITFNESVMNPIPTPYKYKPVKLPKELELDLHDNDLEEAVSLSDIDPYYDDEKKDYFLRIKINDKPYLYKMKDSTEYSIDQMVQKVIGIMRYSHGKALAFIKKNMDVVKESKVLEIKESNPFKSHFVCQVCGNTLDQCTCDIEDEDVLHESITDDNVDPYNKSIIVKTYDYESQLEDLLSHIKHLADIGHSFIIEVDPGSEKYNQTFWIDGDGSFRISTLDIQTPEDLEEDFSSCSATQSSSISGHKVDSIDLIPYDELEVFEDGRL